MSSPSPDPIAAVTDIIFGRWRSQILHCGVKLNIFETVSAESPMTASQVAELLHLDPANTYRLMRALSNLHLLSENEDKTFLLTNEGAVLRADHPFTLRGVTLLEEGPEHYAVWKHLPDMIQDGIQDGFQREFGRHAFVHTVENKEYGEVFDNAMSSYSATQTMWVLQALEGFEEMHSIKSLCDVGGGQGHLICSILQKYNNIDEGIVLEMPAVVNGKDKPMWAAIMGVESRVRYSEGDAFVKVDSADAVIMKMIAHDWNDDECIRLLTNTCEAVPVGGFVMLADFIVEPPNVPSFAKFFDIHMLCVLTGRERTEDEIAGLLNKSGWTFLKTYYPPGRMMGVVVGVKN
jgi:O-methyltransferase domain/Dimerisation domain